MKKKEKIIESLYDELDRLNLNQKYEEYEKVLKQIIILEKKK